MLDISGTKGIRDQVAGSRLRWGAVAAIAAAVLILAWLIVSSVMGSDADTSADAAAELPEPIYGPAIVDEDQLRAETAELGHVAGRFFEVCC